MSAITIVSEMNTENLGNKRPFEERVFARFDAVDARLKSFRSGSTMSTRDLTRWTRDCKNSKFGRYDTKPTWEQALREIVDTRRELSKRLDPIEAVIYETRSDLRDVEDRIDGIERKPPVQ